MAKFFENISSTAIYFFVYGAAAYYVLASIVIGVQDKYFHSFKGTVQERGMKLHYKVVEPYDSWLLWPWQDKNGHAEVKLGSNERVFLCYEDLTSPSLEGRMMVTDSKGDNAQFNDKTKYDRKTRKEVGELENALENVGPDGRYLREIVEAEIQEDIARR